MIALLVLLPLPEAQACSPGAAELVAATPADGAVDVPTDAVVALQFGEGYLADTPTVTVRADGAPVDGTLTLFERTADLVRQTAFARFRPDAALPAGAAVEVEVSGHGWDDGVETFAFTVGAGPLGGEAPAAPVVEALAVVEEEPEAGMMNSCQTERWRELDLTVRPSAADPQGASWIVLRRVALSGEEDVDFDVLGPFSEAAPLTLSTTLSWDIDRDLLDECFVAVQVDAAGRESPASEPACPAPAWECGSACATGTGRPSGLLGVLLALGAAARRRRDPR
jgi:hypothetical protein